MMWSARRKAWLGGLMSLFTVLVCCGSCGVQATSSLLRAFTFDTEQAAAIGREIAQYDLPVGYEEVMAFTLPQGRGILITRDFINMETLESDPAGMFISLLELQNPAGVSDADLQVQLQQALQQQFAFQSMDLRYDRTETRLVNGSEIDFVYRQGETGQGVLIQQMSGLVDLTGGKGFLVIQGGVDAWDSAAVDRFLGSLR